GCDQADNSPVGTTSTWALKRSAGPSAGPNSAIRLGLPGACASWRMAKPALRSGASQTAIASAVSPGGLTDGTCTRRRKNAVTSPGSIATSTRCASAAEKGHVRSVASVTALFLLTLHDSPAARKSSTRRRFVGAQQVLARVRLCLRLRIRLCRAPRADAPARDGERDDALAAEFGGGVRPQKGAVGIANEPLWGAVGHRQPHGDLLPGPGAADAKRPVGQRDAADFVDATGPDPLHVPADGFLGRIVRPPAARQGGKAGQPARAGGDGIACALQGRDVIETRLQFGDGAAGGRFDPALADAMGPFDDGVALAVARPIPEQVDAQAEQPQRQIGRQIGPRAPGRAVVDAQLRGQAPLAKPAAQDGL